jgi:hypothetical protein
LLCGPSKSFATTARTTAVILRTVRNLTLPLMAADRALPVSSETTASKCLIRRLGIFVLIPVSCLSWCLGSESVVLADFSPFTIWAFTASCAVIHTCLPDMRASCWTVVAGPLDFHAAVWLDLDATKQSVVVRVPLLL